MAYVWHRVPCCRTTWKLKNNKENNNELVETKVVCKYNVTSTSEPTALRTDYDQNIFKSMEVDGIMLDELVTEYTFDTTGVHIVKYELYDETKLGNSAPTFYNGNLIEATIPSSVTSIGVNAFNGCTNLSSCTFEENSQLTTIGQYAFTGCSNLTSIEIPSGVTSIGGSAFTNCSSLTSINIPSRVTSISNYTFSQCTSLISVNIPSGVTSMGDGAFQNCSNLTSIEIPSGITSIGGSAFYNCSSLSTITSNATTAPTIQNNTFQNVKTNGTLYVPIGSSGYNVWMGTGNYYLGKYEWTKIEQ